MKNVVLTTFTGSIYEIHQDGTGRWWVRAENIGNSDSRQLNPREWWEITMPSPWPPEHDRGMILISAFYHEAVGHTQRMPGGGKFTSILTSIQILEDIP